MRVDHVAFLGIALGTGLSVAGAAADLSQLMTEFSTLF